MVDHVVAIGSTWLKPARPRGNDNNQLKTTRRQLLYYNNRRLLLTDGGKNYQKICLGGVDRVGIEMERITKRFSFHRWREHQYHIYIII